MSVCANCTNNAAYAYRVGSQTRVLYCTTHLPNFLRSEKYAALIEPTDFLNVKKQDALQKLSFPSAPNPAPKKRRTKKKVVEVKPTADEAVGTLEVHDEKELKESAE